MKGRSSQTNLLKTLEDVTSMLDDGGGVHMIYLDYSKAFDTLYLHKEGTFSSLIPGSQSSARYADLYAASVTHESIELLHYDGKHFNNDAEYNYDQCKQDYIYKV